MYVCVYVYMYMYTGAHEYALEEIISAIFYACFLEITIRRTSWQSGF